MAKRLVEIPKVFTFNLDVQLHAQLSQYHKAKGPGSLAAETIRELLYIGLNAGDVHRGLLAALRVLVVQRNRAYFYRELGQFMEDFSQRTRNLAAETDANAFAEAVMAAQLAASNDPSSNDGGING